MFTRKIFQCLSKPIALQTQTTPHFSKVTFLGCSDQTTAKHKGEKRACNLSSENLPVLRGLGGGVQRVSEKKKGEGRNLGRRRHGDWLHVHLPGSSDHIHEESIATNRLEPSTLRKPPVP